MRFLRNDKFVDKVVTNCGENQLQWQYQKSIFCHEFPNYLIF